MYMVAHRVNPCAYVCFVPLSWCSSCVLCAAGVGVPNFGLTTVELSEQHASSPASNKQTVQSLIHSVISNSAAGADGSGATIDAKLKMEKEIDVAVAKQEESYTTVFEQDTVRPFVASYQKVTETTIALQVAPNQHDVAAASAAGGAASATVLHQIRQTEYKNSRHVFIWSDVPQLSTKDYIQSVYQSFLNHANTAYADLKAEKEKEAADAQK